MLNHRRYFLCVFFVVYNRSWAYEDGCHLSTLSLRSTDDTDVLLTVYDSCHIKQDSFINSHVTSFIFNKNYLSRTRLVDFCLLICLDGSLWDHFLSFWFDRWKNSRIFFTSYLGAMFANTNEFWCFYWCKKWRAISGVTQITKGQSTWKKKHLKKEMENWVSVK